MLRTHYLFVILLATGLSVLSMVLAAPKSTLPACSTVYTIGGPIIIRDRLDANGAFESGNNKVFSNVYQEY